MAEDEENIPWEQVEAVDLIMVTLANQGTRIEKGQPVPVDAGVVAGVSGYVRAGSGQRCSSVVRSGQSHAPLPSLDCSTDRGHKPI